MALADALEKRRRPTRPCPWADLMERMTDEDRGVAEDHMNNGSPLAELIEAIRDEGYSVGDRGAYRHRRGECSCLSQTA